MLPTGHLRIHGTSTFTSRHKLSLVHLRHLTQRSFGFNPKVFEPNVLAHFHAIPLRRPEIRRQSAVHGIAHQIKRSSRTVGKDVFFEVNQFKSMLHGETLNVTDWLGKTLVYIFCIF